MQPEYFVPILMHLEMGILLSNPLQLEAGHTTGVILVIEYLDLEVGGIDIELVSCQEIGVEYRWHALVSYLFCEGTY